MDTSKTQFGKGQRTGWQAKDTIEMGPATNHHGEPATRMLQISTYKSNRGGLVTHASCSLSKDGMMMFDVFGDYSKTVAKLDNRCTEKAVKQLHAAVMEQQADAILAEAIAYYVAKDAAKAMHAKRDADLAAQDIERKNGEALEGLKTFNTALAASGLTA